MAQACNYVGYLSDDIPLGVHRFQLDGGVKPLIAVKRSIYCRRPINKLPGGFLENYLHSVKNFEVLKIYRTSQKYDYAVAVVSLDYDRMLMKQNVYSNFVPKAGRTFMGVVIDYNGDAKAYTISCGPFGFNFPSFPIFEIGLTPKDITSGLTRVLFLCLSSVDSKSGTFTLRNLKIHLPHIPQEGKPGQCIPCLTGILRVKIAFSPDLYLSTDAPSLTSDQWTKITMPKFVIWPTRIPHSYTQASSSSESSHYPSRVSGKSKNNQATKSKSAFFPTKGYSAPDSFQMTTVIPSRIYASSQATALTITQDKRSKHTQTNSRAGGSSQDSLQGGPDLSCLTLSDLESLAPTASLKDLNIPMITLCK